MALGIFLLAALVRVLYVLALRDHPRFDAPVMDPGYHLAWARSLLEGEEFRAGPFFRAPLYPVALAAMLKVSGGSLLGVRLIQALLGALTAALTYRLGARVAGEGSGRIAGVLAALSWTLVAFDAELLIPVLLLPILLVALELTVVWRERAAAAAESSAESSIGGSAPSSRLSRVPLGLFVGLAFGLAAVTRPNVLLFMPLLFLGAATWHRRVQPAIWLTLGTVLPILPVTVHNALEGDVSLIATQGGVNFWIGNNPSSDGSTAIVPGTRDGWWEGYFDAIAQAEAEEGRTLKATEVSRHYRGKATDWMFSEPGAALRQLAWKARLFVANVELANNKDMRFLAFRTMPALRFSPMRWGLLLSLGSVGLALLCLGQSQSRRRGAAVLAGFGTVYALSIVLFFVNARFRLPLVPILSIGSGVALMALWEALQGRRWISVLVVLGPAAAISALSFIEPAGYVASDANGLAELARAELDRGDADAAVRYLEQAIQENPGSVQVRIALAKAIVGAGQDPERSLLLLREAQALPRGKDFPELEVLVLDMQLYGGEAKSTLRGAQALLAKRPKDGSLRLVVARALALSGKGQASVRVLEELLVDEPTNAAAALRAAYIVEQIGSRDAAIAAYKRVVSMEKFATPMMVASARAKLAELGL